MIMGKVVRVLYWQQIIPIVPLKSKQIQENFVKNTKRSTCECTGKMTIKSIFKYAPSVIELHFR